MNGKKKRINFLKKLKLQDHPIYENKKLFMAFLDKMALEYVAFF